jgi:hypothetical protein
VLRVYVIFICMLCRSHATAIFTYLHKSHIYEEFHLLGLMLCSPLKVNWHFGGTSRLHLQGRRISQARTQHENRRQAEQLCLPPTFTLVSCLSYSSTLKMETTCSSETSVDFQRTTLSYVTEDRTLHKHRCGNLRSYISSLRPKSCHLTERDVN